jgi:predicted phosphoribosyltransferase
VVVRDFDIVGIAILPVKADTILLIDADTVLAGPFPFESFEAVAWGYGQFAQVTNPIHLVELPARN